MPVIQLKHEATGLFSILSTVEILIKIMISQRKVPASMPAKKFLEFIKRLSQSFYCEIISRSLNSVEETMPLPSVSANCFIFASSIYF